MNIHSVKKTFSLVLTLRCIVINTRRMVGIVSVHVRGWELHVTIGLSYNDDVDKPGTGFFCGNLLS